MPSVKLFNSSNKALCPLKSVKISWYFYFSFDKEESLHDIFKVNKDPYRIIESLGTIREDKILPEEQLIIFDEIQAISLW